MKQKKFTLRLLVSTILVLFSFSQIQAQDNSKITGPKASPGATQTYSIEIPSFAKFKRPYIHIYITGGVFASSNRSYKKIFTRSLAPQQIRVKWNNSCDVFSTFPGDQSISAYPSAQSVIIVTQTGEAPGVGATSIDSPGSTLHPDFPAGGETLFSNPANFGGGNRAFRNQKQAQFNRLYAALDLCETSEQEINNLIKQVDPLGCYSINIPTPTASECLSIQNEAQTEILTIFSDTSIPLGDKFRLIEEISACVRKQGCTM